jgi:hypothetical protein
MSKNRTEAQKATRRVKKAAKGTKMSLKAYANKAAQDGDEDANGWLRRKRDHK